MALRAVSAKWEQRAREAATFAADKRTTNASEADYYRGIANAYTSAAQDLQEVLATGKDQRASSDAAGQFAIVQREQVEQIITRAGMRAAKLYQHNDLTFSAIFPKMPPMALEERMTRLQESCDTLVILESGKLPNTQEPYIDFGFSAAPEA
jgi:hypothetical protein